MREKRQDLSLKRARAHIRRVLETEQGRDDASATYSLIATHLLALSLKLQAEMPGRPATSRFLHGVLVQLRDDLQRMGVEISELPLPRVLTG